MASSPSRPYRRIAKVTHQHALGRPVRPDLLHRGTSNAPPPNRRCRKNRYNETKPAAALGITFWALRHKLQSWASTESSNPGLSMLQPMAAMAIYSCHRSHRRLSTNAAVLASDPTGSLASQRLIATSLPAPHSIRDPGAEQRPLPPSAQASRNRRTGIPRIVAPTVAPHLRSMAIAPS